MTATIELVRLPIATELGEFIAGYSDKGLARLKFPSKKRAVAGDTGDRVSKQILRWHRLVTRALKQTLAGRDADELPPLDLSGGTDFQRAVWNTMCKIPSGQTRSYGELAEAIGRPKAVRAVGGACGANPIPVLVPCHRVLAAGGKIGGFSSGLEWKRILLERENCQIELIKDFSKDSR